MNPIDHSIANFCLFNKYFYEFYESSKLVFNNNKSLESKKFRQLNIENDRDFEVNNLLLFKSSNLENKEKIVEEFLSLKIKETDIDKIFFKLEEKTLSKIKNNIEKNEKLNNLIINNLIYYINVNLDLFINIIKYMKKNEQKIQEECEKLITTTQNLKEKKDLEDSFKDKNEKELKKILQDFEKRKKRIIFLMEKNYKEILTSNDYNQKILISKYENTISKLEKKQKEIIAEHEKKEQAMITAHNNYIAEHEKKEQAMITAHNNYIAEHEKKEQAMITAHTKKEKALIADHNKYIAEHEKKEKELENKYKNIISLNQKIYDKFRSENDKRFKEIENKLKENDKLKEEKLQLIRKIRENNETFQYYKPKIEENVNLKARIERLEFELKAKDSELFCLRFLSES